MRHGHTVLHTQQTQLLGDAGGALGTSWIRVEHHHDRALLLQQGDQHTSWQGCSHDGPRLSHTTDPCCGQYVLGEHDARTATIRGIQLVLVDQRVQVLGLSPIHAAGLPVHDLTGDADRQDNPARRLMVVETVALDVVIGEARLVQPHTGGARPRLRIIRPWIG